MPTVYIVLQFWEGVMQMKRAGFTYVSYLVSWLNFSFSKISLHSSQSFSSIYHSICDGGDPNRQFINIHFPAANPRELHFTAFSILTEDPMIFIMDCKVFVIVVLLLCGYYVLFEDKVDSYAKGLDGKKYPWPADSFRKYKTRDNPNSCMLTAEDESNLFEMHSTATIHTLFGISVEKKYVHTKYDRTEMCYYNCFMIFSRNPAQCQKGEKQY